MEPPRPDGFAEGVAFDLELIGYRVGCQSFSQSLLRLFEYGGGQNGGAPCGARRKKSSCSLLAIPFDSTFDTDRGDAERFGNLRLSGMPADNELRRDHAKCVEIVSTVNEDRQASMKIGDVLTVSREAQLHRDQGNALRKKRKL